MITPITKQPNRILLLPSPPRREAGGEVAFFAAAAFALLSSAAIAQDTPGQPAATSSVVMKGKAPVNKKLLVVKFPKPKSFTLSNGLTVYVLEDHRFPA